MRMFVNGVLSLAVVALVGGFVAFRADDKKAAKPEMTIKEVMEKYHKGGPNSVLSKVVAGKGSKEDKDNLVLAYTALGLNDPEKGEKASWKKKNDAILAAAKAVAASDSPSKADLDKLKKVTACGACHKDHKN